MSDLRAEIEAAEARLLQMKRRLAAEPCVLHGCDWQSYGGMNAGCDLGGSCGCSVPVNVCSRCGDCDYGDNAEAVETRRKCAETAA